MKANAFPVIAIFEQKLRLEVPLFQRQYVWNRGQQWEPLWEDISRKFVQYLEGRKDAPVHFLGAMVLDQKQTPTTHVTKRQVIDGQQRLTTLQLFLAAFRDFCRESGCEDLAKECDGYTLNRGMMAEPEVDRFKVWPTQLDRSQFSDVMTAGSRAALEEKYPLTRRKYARTYDPRPRMVEAYVFFRDQLNDFFVGSPGEPPFVGEHPLPARLEESFQALKNSLQVVVIDLEHGDDAQVIFETLNARGEPLLPADLLRNFIFLRAARQGEPQETLYEQYWRRFDDHFWRHEVRQGRLSRPRSDLFMQHFLASRLTVDIPVRHLFVEYKAWLERDRPFPTVERELATLARQGDGFRRILEPTAGDVLFGLATFLERFDISTAHPLLLHLLDADISEAEWKAVSEILESYLVRRAVCGYTSKNYNRVFLTLTRTLRRGETSAGVVRRHLAELPGESTGWPSDDEFSQAWRTRHVYRTLQPPKIIHILRRLNDTYLDAKTESLEIKTPLTVEHIMPQSWTDRWPLADGSKGLSSRELNDSLPDSPRAVETDRRNRLLQTFGNLTLVTQALNSSVSNHEWGVKKPALLAASLLPINQQLYPLDRWDEVQIERRGQALLERALRVWPGVRRAPNVSETADLMAAVGLSGR